MTENDDINIVCSRTINDYVIFYDGFGMYQVFYQNELIQEFEMDLNPKTLHRQYKKDWFTTYPKFKELITDNEDLLQLLEHIESKTEQSKTNLQKIMDTFRNLFISLKDAYMDFSVTFDNYQQADLKIKDKFRELLADIEDAENIFMANLVDSLTIDEIIEQRKTPDLTTEQTEIATEIGYYVKKDGLLPYLNNILDDIHIGEHKNIHRKMLMLFNVMRGKGSYLSETTAKAEAGKSFEDEIVFNLIAPPQYIFDVDDITLASFRRYGAINEKYFDRTIVLFGDLGSRNAFQQVEDVFNVFKRLITENKYKSTISDNRNGKGWENVELNLKVDSIGAVYQTTENSFTEDDDQLESRTIFSTPSSINDLEIMQHQFYLNYSKSKQSIDRKKAERQLRNFGLFLMMSIFNTTEIINPYIDVFMNYAIKSENPKRELNQQLQLFDAYCTLTIDKCVKKYMGNTWASLEQLKEYMDYVNLENALIPYEYEFLQMIMADGKSKELTCLYTASDIYNEDGETLKDDIDLNEITTLTECENHIIEIINQKEKQKYIRVGSLDEYDAEKVDLIQSKDDLNNQQLKELPQRLLSVYGIRGTSSDKQDNIFFRISDLQNIYYRYKAYKNVENVPKLLHSLHKKGYLGKYEFKQGKENIYFLTPLCKEITSKFETDKTFDGYATEYIANTGGYDYY